MTHDAERQPFNVQCEPCGYTWTAAWLPMPIRQMARITRSLRCPGCGNGPAKIFLAKMVPPAAQLEEIRRLGT